MIITNIRWKNLIEKGSEKLLQKETNHRSVEETCFKCGSCQLPNQH